MQWLKPYRAFAILAFVLGTALVLIIPPFQSPDEPNHFLRCYQISEGQFVARFRNNMGGGYLPVSLTAVCEPFALVRFNRATTSWQEIRTAMDIPLQPDRRADFVFGNSASYAPLVFLPQAAAIAIGRLANASPLTLMYMARLANLYVWTLISFIALQVAPAFARPLMLLMLMPMSFCQAASLSPDAMTNSLAFLVVALIARQLLTTQTDALISQRWLIAFIVSAAALSLTKAAYMPIAGLILLIPPRHFGNPRRFVTALIIITVACLLPLFIWSRFTPGLDMITYPGPSYVSAHKQFDFLLSHPLAPIQIPFYSAGRDGMLVMLSFVGRLGWLNIQLSPIFVAAYYIALILVSRPSKDQPRLASPFKFTMVVILVIAVSTEAVLILNYLFWTTVGALRVDGLQGRYFIAIAPTVLLLIAAIWSWLPQKFRPLGNESNRNLIAATISIVSCLYTLILLYIHYYVSVGVGLV